MTLYKSLIENISYALRLSLNEMAKSIQTRTIDRKLWLSVASACSRNRSTEAEFIKPVGNDKDLMVLRYVAALLIMKKLCPKSIEDIETIKTYKLVGLKAIDLGATINDIIKVYDENSGKTNSTVTDKINDSSLKTIDTETVLSDDSNVGLAHIDMDMFNSDDDMEGFYDSVLDNTVGLSKNTPLSAACVKYLGIAKPAGFKVIKHTEDEYDKYVYGAHAPYVYTDRLDWWNCSYLSKCVKLLTNKGWNRYSVALPKMKNEFFDCVVFEGLPDDKVKKRIEEYIHQVVNKPKRMYGEPLRDIQETLNKAYHNYETYKEQRKHDISYITDKDIKQMFIDDPTLYTVLVSPDKGLIFKMNRNTEDNFCRAFYRYTITFTGLVNYNKELSNKSANKEAAAESKIRQKRVKIMFDILTKACSLRHIKSWTLCFDDDGYPYIVKPCNMEYIDQTKTALSRRNLYINDTNKEVQSSIFEVIQNKQKYGRSYAKIIGATDLYDKYSKVDDYYVLIKLTDTGIQKLNELMNKKK